MKKNFLLFAISLIFLFSCSEPVGQTQVENNTATVSVSEHLVMATVWYQKSAEMRAIYYQTFNWAERLLAEKVQKIDKNTKKAVIVDIDETMLDNSPFQANLIENNVLFNDELWKSWTDLAVATPLPGAVEFCKYAETLGVEIFYVSNRNLNEIESTLKNMTEVGFPYIDEEHFLFKDETSDKTERRNLIAQNYEIVLLIGDNLRDFDEIFKQREGDLGFGIVEQNKDLFGDKYIILPNPMYGEWEKAVYGGSYPEDAAVADSLRKAILEGF